MGLLDELANLAGSYEQLEGNYYTYHLTTQPAPEMISKQNNIRLFSQNKKRVLEIGFNAGHSAVLFLESNPELELTCVDIGLHKYVQPCYEHIRKHFGDRIKLIVSSSSELMSLGLPLKSFDGIHVDGTHDHPWCLRDTISCLRFMTDEAQLIIDDSENFTQWLKFLQESSLFTLAQEYQPTFLYEHVILNFHRPRVAVCTLIVGEEYASNVERCSKSLQDYCQKWDLPLICSHEYLDPTRPIPWSKIKLLQEHLPKYDFLYWMDADVLICNSEHSMDERLLFLPKGKDVLLPQDHPFHGSMINTGSFLIRNSAFSEDLLKQVYLAPAGIDHQWWEQGSFNLLITKHEIYDKIVILPESHAKLLNSFYFNYSKGNWMIHYASIRGKAIKEASEKQDIETGIPIQLDSLVSLVESLW